MRASVVRIVAAALLGALALGLATAALGRSGAAAIEIGGCTPQNTFIWTGEGDGHNWNDSENWSPEEEAPPKEGDAVVIQGSEGREAEVSGAVGSVCKLTVEGPDSFLTGSRLTVEGDLTWEGGQAGGALSEIEGTFTVRGDAHLAHGLWFPGGRLTVDGKLDVEGGTELTLSGEDVGGVGGSQLLAEGTVEIAGGVGGLLGAKTVIQSNDASSADDNSQLQANGAVALAGDVESSQLDLGLGPHAVLDLGGNTWTLPGLSFSRWKGGAEVKSGGDGGIVAFTNEARLLVDGGVTIGPRTLVSMQGNSTLTDGRHAFPGEPAGGTGLLRGEGTLEWQGGEFEGQLQLAPGFHTVIDSSATHYVADEAGTLLRNEGSIDDQAGRLEVEGDRGRIENWGTFGVHAGAVLACNGDCPNGLDNVPGGRLKVLPQQVVFPPPPPSTTVKLDRLELHNNGEVEIGAGRRLLAENGALATLAEGGALSGGGTLQIGDGSRAEVVGTTVLRGGTALRLDGPGAELHGGLVNGDGQLFGGVLDAATAGDGRFEWVDGGIEGSLLTDRALQTTVSGAGRHDVDGENLDSHDPTRNPTNLTLASPTRIEGVEVDVLSSQNEHAGQRGLGIQVDGPLTLAGPGAGFAHGTSDSDGVFVEPEGSIAAEGDALIDVPLLNTGGLLVRGGTLRIPGGYGQTGPAARTVLDGGAISTEDESGSRADVRLDDGQLLGDGEITVGTLTAAGATVSPGSSPEAPGRLTIHGDYVQGGGGLLALLVAGPVADRHDVLAVDGSASLAGGLAVTDAPGYAPAIPTAIPEVLTAGEVSGSFAATSSIGAAEGTGWEPAYRGGAVDLNLAANGQSGQPGQGADQGAPGGNGGEPGRDAPKGKAGKPKLVLKGATVAVSPRGLAPVRFRNPGTGAVTLLSVSFKTVAQKGAHKAPLTLAAWKSHKSVPAGGAVTVPVHLDARGLTALKKNGKLKATVEVKFKAPVGGVAGLESRLTLDGHKFKR